MPSWDERYAGSDYVYGTEANEFLAAAATHIRPGSVLCICEGEGRNATFLAEQGYAVTAVDNSSVGLAKARRLAARRGVGIAMRQQDLADFEIAPRHWQGIVSIFCHLPPALRARVHRDIVAGLAPGGVFVLEAYTPRQLELKTGGPPTPELMMELNTVRSELAGLDFVIARELERDVHEGQLHHGRGAVVQVLARKPAV